MGGDWADQVKGTFVQLRDFIQAHPHAAPLLVRDLAHSPVAKKRTNVLLRIVSRAGLDPTASASLVSNLVALLVGHSLLAVWVQEKAELRREPGSEDGDGNRAQRLWIHRMLPADLFGSDGPAPAESGWLTTSGLASELTTDAIFLDGLDALIESFGLKPRVPPVPIPR